MLVLPEGFPVNPITLTVIRERARRKGLFTKPDTDPVEIVDIEELEMMEALQEASGPRTTTADFGGASGPLRDAHQRLPGALDPEEHKRLAGKKKALAKLREIAKR